MRKGHCGFGAVVAVALAMWLGGCGGPQSVAQLREDPHTTFSFEVSNDYHTVYERIVRRARQRYLPNPIGTRQPGISANLFPESQSATVTLWDSGGFGIRYRLTAEIRATDEAHTHVELYAARKSDRQEATLWLVWAGTPLEE